MILRFKKVDVLKVIKEGGNVDFYYDCSFKITRKELIIRDYHSSFFDLIQHTYNKNDLYSIEYTKIKRVN
jgi:hypothetical protein